MADDEQLDELDDALAEGPARKRFSGKKIIMIAAPVLLLLLGGGAYFMGLFGGGGDDTHAEAPAEAEPEPQIVFYEVPEMLVNLNTGERKATYLKLRVALEVDQPEAAADLEAKLPRVIDNFQIYLRELRVEDLSGSAGMFRLKEELLRRVNVAVAPTEVKDVLFKEMLVQ
ncbi:MAG: flagellar basal body-associated FliL family protein [Sphingomonadales bacterium]